jgi:dipeptidyl-peptidase-3
MKNGPGDFTLKVASAEPQPHVEHNFKCLGVEAKLKVEYGDFSTALQKVVAALQEVV